jgi:orotate phosphoribosyltransferase
MVASEMKSPREVLIQMILEKSYREGDFTLSSGQKSNYYIDLKPTILHPVGAQAIGRLAADWILGLKDSFGGVGGLTLGADPIVMAVSLGMLEQGRILPATMIRKEPKKHGTSRYVEGVENFPRGTNFLVVEDVVTTGGSAKKAIEILRNEGFQVSQVLSIVDRESGGAEAFRQLDVGFHSLFSIRDIQSAFRR